MSVVRIAVVTALTFVVATSCADQPLGSTSEVSPASTPAPTGVHTEAELEEAAREIVSFLRGRSQLSSFRHTRFAQTVTLVLAPEGGGDQSEKGRDKLADIVNWKVHSESLDADYRFAPPDGNADVDVSVGRHRNCLEYEMSSRAEDFSDLPHVGVTLRYGDGCLQTWNLSFVFDPSRRPPTLIAVVYDQWEW